MRLSDPLRHRLRWIFFGQSGLRPGWGILTFLLLFAVPAAALRFAVQHFFHLDSRKATTIGPIMLIGGELGSIALVAFATAVMARIERRRVARFGFTPTRIPSLFGWGLVTGLAALSFVVAILVSIGALHFDGQLLHGFAIPARGAEWLIGFTLVGLAEESIFRGYIQATLSRGLGFFWAASISSALFGAGHLGNAGENPVGIAAVVLAGLFFCALLRATGSLWCSIGAHAGWDWAQSFLYGVPDSSLMFTHHLMSTHPTGPAWISGGKDGPEGSLIACLLLVVGTVFLLTRPSRLRAAEDAAHAASRQAIPFSRSSAVSSPD